MQFVPVSFDQKLKTVNPTDIRSFVKEFKTYLLKVSDASLKNVNVKPISILLCMDSHVASFVKRKTLEHVKENSEDGDEEKTVDNLTDDEVIEFLKVYSSYNTTDSFSIDFNDVFKNLKLDITIDDVEARVDNFRIDIDRILEDNGYNDFIENELRRKRIIESIMNKIQPAHVQQALFNHNKNISKIDSLDVLEQTLLHYLSIAESNYKMKKLLNNGKSPKFFVKHEPKTMNKDESNESAPKAYVATDKSKNFGRGVRKCYSCGKLGHISKYCRESEAVKQEYKKTHGTNMTTRNNIKPQSSATSASIPKENNSMGNVCLLNATVNGKAIKIMTDSGAEANFIDIECLKMLSVDMVTSKQNDFVKIPGHNYLSVIGYTTLTLSVEDGPKLVDLSFTVLDGHLGRLIVGKPTLVTLGINVDEMFLELKGKEYSFGISENEDENDKNNAQLLFNIEMHNDYDEMNENKNDNANIGFGLLSEKEELPSMDKLFMNFNCLDEVSKCELSSFYSDVIFPYYNNMDLIAPIDYPEINIQVKKDSKELKTTFRRYSEIQKKFMNEVIGKLLKDNLIYKNNNAKYASPVLVVNNEKGIPTRLTVDMRLINSQIEPITWCMPDIEGVLSRLSDAKFYCKIDLRKGYWQVKCNHEAGIIMSFATDKAVYSSNRLIQGMKNSVFIFQSMMQEILNELDIEEYWILWIDDLLLFHNTLEGLLNNVNMILELFDKKKIKISFSKSIFFCTEVIFLGRKITSNGIAFDDDKVQSIIQIPTPKYASELLQFLNMANWLRISIPNYSGISSTLYDLLQSVMKQKGSRLKKDLKNYDITKLWNDDHTKAFQNIKNILNNNILLCHFNDTDDVYLIGDASDQAWGLIICLADPNEKSKPFIERILRPYAAYSGRFKESSLNWHTISKEMFPFVFAADRLNYLLHRTLGFYIVSDNKTLCHIMQPNGYKIDAKKNIMDRIFRWGLKFSGYSYQTIHLDGDHNYYADLVSRWGSQPLNKFIESNDIKELNFVRIASSFNDGFEFPTQNEILNVNNNQQDANGKLYIPNTNNLRERVFCIAHGGWNGHFGFLNTFDTISKQYYWENMKSQIQEWCQSCLHCRISKTPAVIKRPLGEMLRATTKNEILHIDFLYMNKTEQLLNIRDDFSLYSKLYQIVQADAITTAECLLDWFIHFGIPKIIISDKGSQFCNSIIKELLDTYKIRQHIVTVNVHHNNGVIERLNKQVVEVTRSLLSELKLDFKRWKEVLKMVQYSLNHVISDRLGNHTPAEVFLNIPKSNFQLMKQNIDGFETITNQQFIEQFEVKIQHIHNSMLEINKQVQNARDKRSKENQKQLQNNKLLELNIGDYVLMSKNDRYIINKLIWKWCGPMMVKEKLSDYVYRVIDIVSKDEFDAHIERLQFYNDSNLDVTFDLKENAANNSFGYEIDYFVDIREIDDVVQLLVHWRGFEDIDRTWQYLDDLLEDAPKLVHKWLKKNKKNELVKIVIKDYKLRL